MMCGAIKINCRISCEFGVTFAIHIGFQPLFAVLQNNQIKADTRKLFIPCFVVMVETTVIQFDSQFREFFLFQYLSL